MSYHENIKSLAKENTDFRRVVYTGRYSQLVLMSIAPAGEIGEEVHEKVDQFFYFIEGRGEAVIEGKIKAIRKGDGLVVPSGAKHNIRNTDVDDPLQLVTIYSPPNHPDGTVHKTKEDADTAEYH